MKELEMVESIRFSKQKINYILKNKNYIRGFEYHGKKEMNYIKIEIDPIVPKYIWNKVNKF